MSFTKGLLLSSLIAFIYFVYCGSQKPESSSTTTTTRAIVTEPRTTKSTTTTTTTTTLDPKATKVRIPGGKFDMGEDGLVNSTKQKGIEISDFYMDVYEVTNDNYAKFLKANEKWNSDKVDATSVDLNYLKHWPKEGVTEGNAKKPVVYVSWYAAEAYCRYMKGALPTEAQWEYAAGGKDHSRYPLGSQYLFTQYRASKKEPTEVGEFESSSYGLYDMGGNAFEWTADWFNNKATADSKSKNPTGPESGIYKIAKGGSFYYNEELIFRVAYRKPFEPNLCMPDVGFRCVYK